MHQVERAIFDLRRGLPVVVCEDVERPGSGVMVYPIESIGDADLAEVIETTGSAPALTLTRHRMEAMGFSAHVESASLPLKGGDGLSADSLYCAAAAVGATRARLFDEPRPASPAERAALALMRRALLVPAALTARIDGSRRVAVLIGEAAEWPDAVPVRMHSACLTGDLFGSLRCDCGEQLQNAVRAIAELGGGVLLYLAQEGRGIGLANKLRAYELQDTGLDTVDADRVLGFGDDNRRYRVAVDMLGALSIHRVRLLTNNPAKMRALEEGGIEVVARDGLYGRVTQQNRRYLKAKASRSGHLLDDVLDE
jgi:GTP cyclohydrolase II